MIWAILIIYFGLALGVARLTWIHLEARVKNLRSDTSWQAREKAEQLWSEGLMKTLAAGVFWPITGLIWLITHGFENPLKIEGLNEKA